MTEAEAYVSVVLAHIPVCVASQPELRRWWTTEAQHRRRYGVTEEQEAQIIEACRIRMPDLLEETPASTLTPEPRASVFGRRNTGQKKRYGG